MKTGWHLLKNGWHLVAILLIPMILSSCALEVTLKPADDLVSGESDASPGQDVFPVPDAEPNSVPQSDTATTPDTAPVPLSDSTSAPDTASSPDSATGPDSTTPPDTATVPDTGTMPDTTPTPDTNPPPDPCVGVICSGHGQCVPDGYNNPSCVCDPGYHPEGLACVQNDPCEGVTCSGHGQCSVSGNTATCICDSGYHPVGINCVSNSTPCDGLACSDHGQCVVQNDKPVCACYPGFTPSNSVGLDCVPTETICIGGAINYDVDGDGTKEDWFEPTADECFMYEIVNYTRATHDDEGTPECHTPLGYNVEWSAHARNHSIQMAAVGSLWHEDYPSGQNCAYGGGGPDYQVNNMYMSGPNEPHCPDLSHHCNIMRCTFSQIGIGYEGTYNTQNFL